jgi:hypothetical protein
VHAVGYGVVAVVDVDEVLGALLPPGGRVGGTASWGRVGFDDWDDDPLAGEEALDARFRRCAGEVVDGVSEQVLGHDGHDVDEGAVVQASRTRRGDQRVGNGPSSVEHGCGEGQDSVGPRAERVATESVEGVGIGAEAQRPREVGGEE